MDTKLLRLSMFNLSAGVIIGGAGSLLWSHSAHQSKATEPKCYLDENAPERSLGALDGKVLTWSQLPANLQTHALKAELEFNRRNSEIIDEVAVRYMKAKETGQSTTISALPTLNELAKINITDADVRIFFEANKASFPQTRFEHVKPMIRNHLEQQKRNSFLQSNLTELKKNPKFRIQRPIICGQKVHFDTPNEAYDQGKGKKFELVMISDYQCAQCRFFKKSFDKLAETFSETIKITTIMHPGERKESSNEYLVRGTFCAKKLADEAQQSQYIKNAYSSEIKYDTNGIIVDNINFKETAISIAKSINLDADAFEACLSTNEAKSYSDAGRRFFAEVKADQTPTIFLNKRRFLVPVELNPAEEIQNLIQ